METDEAIEALSRLCLTQQAIIAALEAKLDEIMSKLAGAMEANTARFDQLDAEVQKMSKVPTAEPRKRTSDAIVENIKLSRNTNFEALTNNLKNLK